MTVALFGGSFNPPHLAHVLAAVTVRLTHAIDRVIVMPAFRHPFDKELAPYEDRVAMCELAFHGIPDTVVSRLEQERALDGRTLSTVLALRECAPDEPMRLVIGGDILGETAKWYRWDKVAELAPPLVLSRQGASGTESQRALLPMLSSTEVRELVGQGQWEAVSKLVPRDVLRYMRDRNLYRER